LSNSKESGSNSKPPKHNLYKPLPQTIIMGRIKSLMVKRAAKQLLEGEHIFDESFEHNKKILGNTMPSKPIRNKIAGYIARLNKMKRVKKDAATPKPAPAAPAE
jgi:ribosomal protein S17E